MLFKPEEGHLRVAEILENIQGINRGEARQLNDLVSHTYKMLQDGTYYTTLETLFEITKTSSLHLTAIEKAVLRLIQDGGFSASARLIPDSIILIDDGTRVQLSLADGGGRHTIRSNDRRLIELARQCKLHGIV